MTQQQMRDAIAHMRESVINAAGKQNTAKEAEYLALMVTGFDLVGELLVDIKRIADAAEQSYP